MTNQIIIYFQSNLRKKLISVILLSSLVESEEKKTGMIPYNLIPDIGQENGIRPVQKLMN